MKKMSKRKKIYVACVKGIASVSAFVVPMIVLAPALAFAQASATNSTGSSLTQTSDLNGLVTKAIGLFNSAIYLIVALAILTFVWNVYQYFVVNDPENKKDAGKYVMYSIIGIFVILSFWGLVSIISNTLNINNNPGTLNVGNLIGNITGSSGTSGSSAGTPNFLSTSGSSGTGNSIYNTSATNNSGSSFTTNSQSQAAYQQQANQAQAALQANGCLTISLGTVNTPTCQNLQSQYNTAQNQANIAAQASGQSNPAAYQSCVSSGGPNGGAGDPATCAALYGGSGTGTASSQSLSQMQTNFENNCINSAGAVIQLPSCLNQQTQLQATQSASDIQACINEGEGDSTYCNNTYSVAAESGASDTGNTNAPTTPVSCYSPYGCDANGNSLPDPSSVTPNTDQTQTNDGSDYYVAPDQSSCDISGC